MKYYIIHENEIYIANNPEALSRYYDDEIHELPEDYEAGKYVVKDGELVDNTEEWEAELAKYREETFKAGFFEIQNFGWYRKTPKGYTSALESLTVAYNMITSGVIQELPAGTFIFYPEPDYTKPKECTEEWLVAHQILSQSMNLQQFVQFYATFVVSWNKEMHENSNEVEETPETEGE